MNCKLVLFFLILLTARGAQAFTCKKVAFGTKSQVFCPHNRSFYQSLNRGKQAGRLGESKSSDNFICKKVSFEGKFQVFCPHSNLFYDPIFSNIEERVNANSGSRKPKELLDESYSNDENFKSNTLNR